MLRILVCDPIAEEGLERLRAAGHQVEVKTGLSPEALAKEIAPYQVVVVRSATKVTKAVVEAGASLKAVMRGGVGLDNIDAEACAARGVAVLSTPEAATVSVAEHALALLFALADSRGLRVAGRTLGLIGLGRIGAEAAARAQGVGLRVLAVRRDASRGAPAGVELRGLDELLGAADFVSVHVPGGPGTKGLLGRPQFARFKPGALLIDCSRGGVVDEAALVEALRSGRLAGAALDVFAQEPLPPGHPLLGLPNVILTPHIGAMTREAQERVGLAVAERLLAQFPPG